MVKISQNFVAFSEYMNFIKIVPNGPGPVGFFVKTKEENIWIKNSFTHNIVLCQLFVSFHYIFKGLRQFDDPAAAFNSHLKDAPARAFLG